MASNSIDVLVQKAQAAVAEGKYDEARECYMKALGIRPDLPSIHYGLATVCYLLNELPNAAYHFKEVTRLDPLRAGAYVNLGAVYNKLGELDEAVTALRRGIQLDLNRSEGYYNLGLVYRRKGQTELAIQAYREAVRVKPNMADGHYNLANLYLEKNQFNMALKHYQLAVELRPNWEKALAGLDQARAALQENEGPQPSSIEDDIDNEEEESTQQILDPERTVDPYIHGTILADLHHATKESEKIGKDFVNLLQSEIEPAIKLLSGCLLYTRQSNMDLDQSVQKVEQALAHMHAAQRKLQKSMNNVRTHGDQLLAK